MRTLVIAGVLALVFGALHVAPVAAEDQSKQGDPTVALALEEGFKVGMRPHIAKIGQSHNIPTKVVDDFVQCFARVMVGYVDTSDQSLREDTPETHAKIAMQMLGGLAPSVANGADPLGEACPKEAKAYRSYL